MAFAKTVFQRFLRIAASALALAAFVFWSYALLPVLWEPPRLEQEYKLSLSGTLSDDQKTALYRLVASELPKRDWENAKFVTGSYYMGSDLDTLYFEDTYFDTPSGDLEKSWISHRLRYRWNAASDVFSYRSKNIVPQRMELQTKAYWTGSIADSEWYKRALKNRYEIKKDYRLNFVTNLMLRRENGDALVSLLGIPLVGSRFSPVALVVDAMDERGARNFKYSDLGPRANVVIKRTRFHVNKTTPFGYGDNPDNVFLVTIDEASVYAPGTEKVSATFSEIEIDFERNTFFKLFDSVYKAKNDENLAVLASFEADQKRLKSLIAEELSQMWFPPETGEVVSKYSKAVRASEK